MGGLPRAPAAPGSAPATSRKLPARQVLLTGGRGSSFQGITGRSVRRARWVAPVPRVRPVESRPTPPAGAPLIAPVGASGLVGAAGVAGSVGAAGAWSSPEPGWSACPGRRDRHRPGSGCWARKPTARIAVVRVDDVGLGAPGQEPAHAAGSAAATAAKATQPASPRCISTMMPQRPIARKILDHTEDGIDDFGHWAAIFGSGTVAAGFLDRLRWDFQRRFPALDERFGG